jgi:hypothetical protein
MFEQIKALAHYCRITFSPFYSNPIDRMPGSVNFDTAGRVLPNPHMAIDNLVTIFKNHRDVHDALRRLDGEHLLYAKIEENSINRGTLWVNVYRLGSTLDMSARYRITPACDAVRVCATGWKENGHYQFFVDIEHNGLRCRSSIRAIKDDRKYAAQYNPYDPEQTWGIELGAEEMAMLGFSKH